ncbi:serine hydroxymethyltransferase 7-like protein [Tanacetum coccineum]|uniref:Serine hydroxymethyltransferase 7-like protein n=1 Tax=Tanacetum coccineum TaxID=301880 RepID=A0ABQ5J548_9ASTR
MKRKRIETLKTDLERSKTGGHLQELEQATKSKNYALMWVVQMEREMEKIIDAEENDNIACAELTLNRFKNSGNGKRPVDGVVDYEMLKERVMNFRQKILICGGNSYLRDWDYGMF